MATQFRIQNMKNQSKKLRSLTEEKINFVMKTQKKLESHPHNYFDQLDTTTKPLAGSGSSKNLLAYQPQLHKDMKLGGTLPLSPLDKGYDMYHFSEKQILNDINQRSKEDMTRETQNIFEKAKYLE